MISKGDTVKFEFTLHRVTLADPVQRRSGTGIALEETYSVRSKGWAVRVTESPNYQPGEVVYVSDINVRLARCIHGHADPKKQCPEWPDLCLGVR